MPLTNVCRDCGCSVIEHALAVGLNAIEQLITAVHTDEPVTPEEPEVKNGIIEEALVETIGCSGMTHSAAMAAEILQGKTLLEALNTDLVCDAINVAMREIFKQLAYGRTQTAFSEDGLPIGAGLEDLGKGLCSQVGTIYATREKGPRYLQLTEGYILSLALDANDEIIGYKFCHLGKMMAAIRKGEDPKAAYEKNISTYGRYADAAKYIDPRAE